jgi:20S proteasome subunit alpha 2
MGRGGDTARNYLEKTYQEDIDIEDAIHSAIKCLKDSFEGELTERNIEIGVIKSSDKDKAFKQLSQSEIVDLLREVE